MLGGGIVKGSLVLVGGDPGIGKSTLLLQICEALGNQNKQVMYISGEESVSQIKLRADRLNVSTANLTLLAETNMTQISQTINNRSLYDLSPGLCLSYTAAGTQPLQATAHVPT